MAQFTFEGLLIFGWLKCIRKFWGELLFSEYFRGTTNLLLLYSTWGGGTTMVLQWIFFIYGVKSSCFFLIGIWSRLIHKRPIANLSDLKCGEWMTVSLVCTSYGRMVNMRNIHHKSIPILLVYWLLYSQILCSAWIHGKKCQTCPHNPLPADNLMNFAQILHSTRCVCFWSMFYIILHNFFRVANFSNFKF